MSKRILGREILTKPTFRREQVEIPELDGVCFIRELSAAEVVRGQAIATGAIDMETRRVTDVEQLAKFQGHVIVAGWINEDGSNVLAPADVDAVLALPSKVVNALSTAIITLSGMETPQGENDGEAAKND